MSMTSAQLIINFSPKNCLSLSDWYGAVVTLCYGEFLCRDIGNMLKCKVKQCIFVRLRGEAFHLFDELGDKGRI